VVNVPDAWMSRTVPRSATTGGDGRRTASVETRSVTPARANTRGETTPRHAGRRLATRTPGGALRTRLGGGGRPALGPAHAGSLAWRRPALCDAVSGLGTRATEVVQGVSFRRHGTDVDPVGRDANTQEVGLCVGFGKIRMGPDGIELDVAAATAGDVEHTRRRDVLAARQRALVEVLVAGEDEVHAAGFQDGRERAAQVAYLALVAGGVEGLVQEHDPPGDRADGGDVAGEAGRAVGAVGAGEGDEVRRSPVERVAQPVAVRPLGQRREHCAIAAAGVEVVVARGGKEGHAPQRLAVRPEERR